MSCCLMVEMTEREIIEKLKANDVRVQKYLYEKYKSLFYAIALRYSSSKHEAKDILQDAFMKIFTKINTFEANGSLEGWMKRIVVNCAINYYRFSHRHFFEDIDELNEAHEPFDFNEDDFTYEELIAAISSLPSGYRTIFNLYAIEGYKHKEISELLNITESTSKSQYHRAKLLLQKKLLSIKKVKNAKH